MASLYELTTQYASLIDRYDTAEDDEERAEVLEMLDGINDSIADKAEAYARIMRNKKGEAEMYKAEAKRLNKKAEAAETVVENLKARLLDAMKLADATELNTSIGRWRTQQGPWSAEITDESAIPTQFRIPQPDKIDRKGLIDHFKQTGELLDGVEYKRNLNLQFR